jgi:type IV pilus assembly protein PilX
MNDRIKREQQGVALIVGLVILAVLSVIGVAAFSVATQEQRMAGNSRDRIVAFEAAEAALRSCEAKVAATGAGFGTSGIQGMYVAPPSTQRGVAEDPNVWTNPAQVYQDPNLDALNQLSHQWRQTPACVAEYFQVTIPPNPPGTPVTFADMAHITARGWGLNSNTFVQLESYYAL